MSTREGQIPDAVQVPTYPQYTNLALNEGLFDQLMITVEAHLDKQVNRGLINRVDGSKVYVGALEAVLQNTTQYLLGIMLLEEQKSKIAAEVSMLTKQEEKIDADIALLELQKEEIKWRLENLLPLEKEQMQLNIDTGNYNLNNILPAQLAQIQAETNKTDAEKLLIDQRTIKVSDEIEQLNSQTALQNKQADKIDKEIEYLTARIKTELANTEGSPGGLIGKQMDLLNAQRLGFAGDLWTKAGKVYADYDSVFLTVSEDPEAASLSGSAISMLNSASSAAGAM